MGSIFSAIRPGATWINAAFDIYYIGGKSVRELSFVPTRQTSPINIDFFAESDH